MSLLIVKDPTKNVLNFALTEEEKVTEVKMKMDKVNRPDKILFHKQTNEMIYYDLLHMSLNKNKLENKVDRLEQQLKKEKAMILEDPSHKTYENELIVVGVQPKEKQSVKKLLDEKEKVIKTLKKKLKIPVTYHTQTEELVELQKERDDFEQETLNLKAKILQLTQDKEKLEQQVNSDVSAQVPTQESTEGITTTMYQISLKDDEIKNLKENNLKLQQEAKSPQKAKESLQHVVDKHKAKMNGRLHLKGAKHTMWDHIIIEVTKLQDFLNFF